MPIQYYVKGISDHARQRMLERGIPSDIKPRGLRKALRQRKAVKEGAQGGKLAIIFEEEKIVYITDSGIKTVITILTTEEYYNQKNKNRKKSGEKRHGRKRKGRVGNLR